MSLGNNSATKTVEFAQWRLVMLWLNKRQRNKPIRTSDSRHGLGFSTPALHIHVGGVLQGLCSETVTVEANTKPPLRGRRIYRLRAEKTKVTQYYFVYTLVSIWIPSSWDHYSLKLAILWTGRRSYLKYCLERFLSLKWLPGSSEKHSSTN